MLGAQHTMLKKIAIALLILFIGLYTLLLFHNNAERYFDIISGKVSLGIAAKDFAKFGYVTNVYNSSCRFWLSTNIVTIDGIQHQCYAEFWDWQFRDEGTLAITTNQTFIWLDSKRPPKIIGPNYRPPFFSSHF
jgi:hypothetical protein